MLMISLVFFELAIAAFLWNNHASLDNKSEDYRAMAEGCRVRFFWQVAGITGSIRDAYLSEQRTELDWIRNALLGWEVDLNAYWPGTWTNLKERAQFALDYWVGNQVAYYEGAAETNHRHARRHELLVRICVLGAVLLAFALLVVRFSPAAEWAERQLNEVPVIVIDLLLAAGAVLHHYSERRAYHEHRKQYTRALVIFKNAARGIRRSWQPETDESVEGAVVWLEKLGDEALKENGDWVLLHRARPLELPHP
jgi:uncharacterized membrane protein YidH (DUF202 family)